MRYCNQCGEPLKRNARFCTLCGASLTDTNCIRICEHCGEHLEHGVSFCPNCGERLFAPVIERKDSSKNKDNGRGNLKKQEYGFKLSDYIGKVVALEKSLYKQSKTIDEMVSHVDDLGHQLEFEKPHQPAVYSENYLEGTGTACGFGGFFGGLIGWIFFDAPFVGSVMISAVLCVCIVLAFHMFEENSVNKKRQEEYENAMEVYNCAVNNDDMRVKAEIDELNKLCPVIVTMEEKRDETISILNQYYEKNIIFPKYRNLVAMCSIYEYFISGRCTELTGHEGAYNIYENEARLERICTKLDEVIERLDQIKANQYVLYDAIQEGNRTAQMILEESIKQTRIAARIEENTAIAAHYSEIAAKNTEACAWIGVANYVSIQESRK